MKLMNSLDLQNLTFLTHDESEFDERQLEVLYDAISKDIDMSKSLNKCKVATTGTKQHLTLH